VPVHLEARIHPAAPPRIAESFARMPRVLVLPSVRGLLATAELVALGPSAGSAERDTLDRLGLLGDDDDPLPEPPQFRESPKARPTPGRSAAAGKSQTTPI